MITKYCISSRAARREMWQSSTQRERERERSGRAAPREGERERSQVDRPGQRNQVVQARETRWSRQEKPGGPGKRNQVDGTCHSYFHPCVMLHHPPH